MKRKKKKCKEKSAKITGMDMPQKQSLNAEKIVEKFEIRCVVEKERVATPVRPDLIQKKQQDYTIRRNVRPKQHLKHLRWLFTYEKLITAFANQK